MSELSEIVFGQQSLGDILGRVSTLAMLGLVGCDGASLRLRGTRTNPIFAASDELATSIESIQEELNEGPCVTCLDDHAAQSITSVGEDQRWRRFAARAFAEGLGSCLAVPLGVLGTFEGALNFYWQSPQDFSESQWRVASSITDEATPTVANAVEMSLVAAEVARLSLELENDEDHLLAQAVGILQARHRLSEADARRQLQTSADKASVTLEEAAGRLLRDM